MLRQNKCWHFVPFPQLHVYIRLQRSTFATHFQFEDPKTNILEGISNITSNQLKISELLTEFYKISVTFGMHKLFS